MANRPENFEIINEEKILIGSDEFRLEADMSYDGDVWIFPENEGMYSHAMYFRIDWAKNQFQMLKAILGDGRNFEDVTGSKLPLNLHRNYYETKEAFLKFLMEYAAINLNKLKR